MDLLVYQEPNALGHPMEDRCLVSEDGRCLVVADGVTRDSYDRDPHPGGSGAAVAAGIFCRRVLDLLSHEAEPLSAASFRSAFDAANLEIRGLNRLDTREEATDYLDGDLYGTVGLVACLRRHDEDVVVRYGYVGDCRIAVARSGRGIQFENPSALDGLYAYLAGKQFAGPSARRQFVRSKLRNNPHALDPSWRAASYGVFTGEEEVRQFYRFGTIHLTSDPGLLVFSDGITPFVDCGDFRAALFDYLEGGTSTEFQRRARSLFQRWASVDPARYGDDKSLIVVRLAT